MPKKIKVLVLGDLIGQPGCRAVFISLSKLIKKYSADIVIVNGENADKGFGIVPELADKMFSAGVDVITSGNHIWQKDYILPYLKQKNNLLRPANYNKKAPGHGSTIIQKKGINIGVINLIGRVNLVSVDCPFQVGKKIVNEIKKNTDIIIVDFHAESVEEKEALSYHLDGFVSLLFGTHTHVQTADERILPKGCAYITDIGMTGPIDSVIGSEPQISIDRVCTQLPLKSIVADNDSVINGIICEIDVDTKKAISIERVVELV